MKHVFCFLAEADVEQDKCSTKSHLNQRKSRTMKKLFNEFALKGIACVAMLASVSIVSAQNVTPRVFASSQYNEKMGMWFKEEAASWGGFLTVQNTAFNSVARRTGLENGDQIARVNGERVQTADDLRLALGRAPRVSQLQVRNVRTGQWMYVTMTLPSNIGNPLPPHVPNQPNNPPPPPNGNAGGQPNNPRPPMGTPNPRFLQGRWNTNLGASVSLTHIGMSNRLVGSITVPIFGTSELRLAVNGQTSRIDLTYRRLDGRDSGTGQLTMVSSNRLEGFYTNRQGVRVRLVLTR